MHLELFDSIAQGADEFLKANFLNEATEEIENAWKLIRDYDQNIPEVRARQIIFKTIRDTIVEMKKAESNLKEINM